MHDWWSCMTDDHHWPMIIIKMETVFTHMTFLRCTAGQHLKQDSCSFFTYERIWHILKVLLNLLSSMWLFINQTGSDFHLERFIVCELIKAHFCEYLKENFSCKWKKRRQYHFLLVVCFGGLGWKSKLKPWHAAWGASSKKKKLECTITMWWKMRWSQEGIFNWIL